MKRFILLLVIYGFVVGDLYAKVPTTCHKIRLKDNWEFLRQDVGNIWELVRPVKKGTGRTTYMDSSNSSALF